MLGLVITARHSPPVNTNPRSLLSLHRHKLLAFRSFFNTCDGLQPDLIHPLAPNILSFFFFPSYLLLPPPPGGLYPPVCIPRFLFGSVPQ